MAKDLFRHYRMRVEGVELPYVTGGRGRPLFFVPAFHSDLERFGPILEYLARSFQVIAPELPGIANREILGNGKHTAASYAKALSAMVEKMRVRGYILAGVCLGAVIAIRMLQQGVVKPRHVILIEGIYDGDLLHIEPYLMVIVRLLLRLGAEHRLAQRIARGIIYNRHLLTTYYTLKYRRQPDRRETVSHQLDLTLQMNAQAWLELILDMFSLRLSQENLVFSVPTTLVYNHFDNILDSAKTIAGMKRIFPNAEIVRLALTEHAPADRLDASTVRELVAPLRQTLELLMDGRHKKISYED